MSLLFWQVAAAGFFLLALGGAWLNSRILQQNADMLEDRRRFHGIARDLLQRAAEEIETLHDLNLGDRGDSRDWEACRAGECATCQLVAKLGGLP